MIKMYQMNVTTTQTANSHPWRKQLFNWNMWSLLGNPCSSHNPSLGIHLLIQPHGKHIAYILSAAVPRLSPHLVQLEHAVVVEGFLQMPSPCAAHAAMQLDVHLGLGVPIRYTTRCHLHLVLDHC